MLVKSRKQGKIHKELASLMDNDHPLLQEDQDSLFFKSLEVNETKNDSYMSAQFKKTRNVMRKSKKQNKIQIKEAERQLSQAATNYIDNTSSQEKQAQKITLIHSEDTTIKLINKDMTKTESTKPQNSDLTLLATKQLVKQYLLPECVNKSKNTLFGYFGYTTILTSFPLLQGAYYIEIKILPSSLSKHVHQWPAQSRTSNGASVQSLVRVGIADPNYNLLIPLGGLKSYAYKSVNGHFLANKTDIMAEQGPPYSEGDILGMHLNLGSPIPQDRFLKVKSKEIKNPSSKLSFYRNGQLVGEIKDLLQQTYVFGVSLYNWANVQFNWGPKFTYAPTQHYVPYSQIDREKPVHRITRS